MERGWAQLLLTDLEIPLQLRPRHPPMRTLRGPWCVQGGRIGATESPRALATRGLTHVNYNLSRSTCHPSPSTSQIGKWRHREGKLLP